MSDRDKLLPNTSHNPPPPYNYGYRDQQQHVPPSAAAPPPPPYYTGQYQQQHHQPPRPQNNTIVVTQGIPVATCTVVRPIPPDYTYLAVIGIVFFFPLGLLALHFATKARRSVISGDISKAYGEAFISRMLARLSISLGCLVLTGIILAIVLPITLSNN